MNNQQNSKLNLHNTIASRIKQRFIDLNMQQKDIINALGVPKSTISEWVKKDEKRTPNTEYLIELAECLNCSVDYLLGLTNASMQLNTDDNKALRISCDYTGLDEDTINNLHQEYELKDMGNSNYLAFIDFITKDCFSFQCDLDRLTELTKEYIGYLTVRTNDEICVLNCYGTIMDDTEKELNFSHKIDELQTNINATKYTLWQKILSYIDDFSLFYIDNFNQYDLSELEKTYFSKRHKEINQAIENLTNPLDIKNKQGETNE